MHDGCGGGTHTCTLKSQLDLWVSNLQQGSGGGVPTAMAMRELRERCQLGLDQAFSFGPHGDLRPATGTPVDLNAISKVRTSRGRPWLK